MGLRSLPPQTFVEGLWPGHVTSPTCSPCPPPALRPDAGCWACAHLGHVEGGCRVPLSRPPISFSQWTLSPRPLGSCVTPGTDAIRGHLLASDKGSGLVTLPAPPSSSTAVPAAVTATAGPPLKHGTPGAPASLPKRPLAGESNRRGQGHVSRDGILLPQRVRRAGPQHTAAHTRGDGQQTSPVHPGHRGRTRIPKPTARPTRSGEGPRDPEVSSKGHAHRDASGPVIRGSPSSRTEEQLWLLRAEQGPERSG